MDDVNEIRMPDADEAAVEAAVLQQLLALHPVQLNLDDVAREVAGEAAGFAGRDEVERAVRRLAAAGLANHNGDLVLPSRAALRMDQLLE